MMIDCGRINSLCCLVAWLCSVENSQMAWLAMIKVRKDAVRNAWEASLKIEGLKTFLGACIGND